MKTISILIPTYNEEDNVEPLSEAIIKVFTEKLPAYDYEIVFIDNHSQDHTREKILKLGENKKIKAIFNAKNFGHIRSPYYGLIHTTGDCTIVMCADFQDPPELIVDFVRQWEQGYRIVIGIKNKSKESKLMYFLRSLYYKLIKKISDCEQIEQFTGFGLYDQSFVKILRDLKDPIPYLRGIVAELGYDRKEIFYEQPQRKAGKTKNNFYTLYDMGMLGITSYSKVVLRLATMTGFVLGFVCGIIGIFYLILKLIYWDMFPAGSAPILIGMFFLGAIQLFFIGILGEYIMNINTRVMNRPLVVEEKRMNFEKEAIQQEEQYVEK